MFLRSWHHPVRIVAVGVLSAGLLSGCGGEVTIPVPNLSSAATEVAKLGEGAMQALKDQLSKVVDFNLPVEKQLEQLESGANKLYCDLKGTPPAGFVRDVANSVREDIVTNNPGVAIRPLNISDQC